MLLEEASPSLPLHIIVSVGSAGSVVWALVKWLTSLRKAQDEAREATRQCQALHVRLDAVKEQFTDDIALVRERMVVLEDRSARAEGRERARTPVEGVPTRPAPRRRPEGQRMRIQPEDITAIPKHVDPETDKS